MLMIPYFSSSAQTLSQSYMNTTNSIVKIFASLLTGLKTVYLISWILRSVQMDWQFSAKILTLVNMFTQILSRLGNGKLHGFAHLSPEQRKSAPRSSYLSN